MGTDDANNRTNLSKTYGNCSIQLHSPNRKMRKWLIKSLFSQCGSYHIGKERAYLGAAKLLGWKVWCDANKRRVRCIDSVFPATLIYDRVSMNK